MEKNYNTAIFIRHLNLEPSTFGKTPSGKQAFPGTRDSSVNCISCITEMVSCLPTYENLHARLRQDESTES